MKYLMMETATVRQVLAMILIMVMVFGILSAVRAQIEPIYCHQRSPEDASSSATGRSHDVHIRLGTNTVCHINPYGRDAEEDARGLVNCTWIFTVTDSHSSAVTAVVELQRKGGGQVMAGDMIPNLVITVDDGENRTTYLLRSNMSLIQMGNDGVLTVSLRSLGVSTDNELFIRMFLVSGGSCPSDSELFHKYGNSCITVRPANFICATNEHLNNCSLMTQMAIQTSADELTELVRNVSFNKEFSQSSLSSPTVISGFLCEDGILKACARTASSTGHSCRWRSAPGKPEGIAGKCSATSGLQYLTVKVTGHGKPVLDLVSPERASRLPVLLAITADQATEALVPTTTTTTTTTTPTTTTTTTTTPTTTTTTRHITTKQKETFTLVSSVPSSPLMIGTVVTAFVTLLVIVGICAGVITIISIKCCHRNTNPSNTDVLENGHRDPETAISLVAAESSTQ